MVDDSLYEVPLKISQNIDLAGIRLPIHHYRIMCIYTHKSKSTLVRLMLLLNRP